MYRARPLQGAQFGIVGGLPRGFPSCRAVRDPALDPTGPLHTPALPMESGLMQIQPSGPQYKGHGVHPRAFYPEA